MKKIQIEHVPTQKMPENPEFPYRLFCPLCGKTTAASDNPIPDQIRNFLEGTPCSKCVDPAKFLSSIF